MGQALEDGAARELDRSELIDREDIMIKNIVGAGVALGLLAGTASAQAILTAETGPPGTVPFTSMTALAEIAATKGVADFQVADSQTLTNSL